MSVAGPSENRKRRLLLDAVVLAGLILIVAGVYWYDRPTIKTIALRDLWNLSYAGTTANQLSPAAGRKQLAETAAEGKSPQRRPSPPRKPIVPERQPAPSVADQTPAKPTAEPVAKPVEPPARPAETKQPPSVEPPAEKPADGPAAAPSKPVPPEQAAEALLAALALQQVGDLQAARDKLRSLVAQYPDTPAAADAQQRLPGVEVAFAEERCQRVLRLAAETQAAGKLAEAHQMLEAVIQGYPDTKAAADAQPRLQAVIQAEQEQRAREEAVARQRATAKRVQQEQDAAQALQQAVAAEEKGELEEAQRLLQRIAQDYGNTPAAREARQRAPQVDAALEEKHIAKTLELAKVAQREGRYQEARRALERLVQEHPNTPAAEEARNLILAGMAAAREQKEPRVQTFREPPPEARPSLPRPRADDVAESRPRELKADPVEEEQRINAALAKAKTAQQEGRYSEARRTLERLVQEPPNTPAAEEARNLILAGMAAARQEEESRVQTFREPPPASRPSLPRPRDDAVAASRPREPQADPAEDEKQIAAALARAKLAQQEGRYDDARRTLERVVQEHPNTPAAKEATSLILAGMAATRQPKEARVQTFREPPPELRPPAPRPREERPPRDTAGSATAKSPPKPRPPTPPSNAEQQAAQERIDKLLESERGQDQPTHGHASGAAKSK